MAQTYTDAVGAVMRWINSRTDTLVGAGHPLQKGASPRLLTGAGDACYAYLTALPAGTFAGAENATMLARISAQVYGPTTLAVANAAAALADELETNLAGRPTDVAGARLLVGDDLSGPSDQPDFDLPRQVLDFSVALAPL
jgi:hypothetical protein